MKVFSVRFLQFPSYLIIFISILSCSSQKDFIIESDYCYSGNFKKYKTFTFTQMQENETLPVKDVIEETIIYRMKSQGYSHTTNKPDLLITYKVFVEDFAMTGYNQPNIEAWVYNDWGDKLMKDGVFVEAPPSSHMTAEYKGNKYTMNNGTLLVTFYDRKWRKTVWQGYASGIFSEEYEGTVKNVKTATSKIFNQFRLIANGYVQRKDT